MIEVFLSCMPVLIAGLFFLAVLMVSRSYHPGRKVIKTYERVSRHLKEQRSSIFDYDRMEEFLLANGGTFHYGKWVEPIKFLIMRFLTAILLFSIAIRFNGILAVICAILGYQLPEMMLVYLNKRDNDRMVGQIKTVYNVLSVQIESGVYVSDALTECSRNLPAGRLRTSMMELSSELILKNSFENAVNNFNRKFNNSFIEALCSILIQAQESGQAVELLRDLSDQMKDMQAALFAKKKGELNRATTVSIIGVLSAALAVIIYTLVGAFYSTAVNL